MVLSPDSVVVVALSIFLFLALCAALVLVTLALRRPSDTPLIVAGVLVVVCLLAVVVSPFNIPLIAGLMVALLGTALAVLGGNPMTRRILAIATHGSVREGIQGGILVGGSSGGEGVAASAPREVMRGGATIGYLERTAVVLSIVAGYPEGLAVVVAVKGVGRFSELAAAEARERFIIGTLASILWAAVVGGLVRLALT